MKLKAIQYTGDNLDACKEFCPLIDTSLTGKLIVKLWRKGSSLPKDSYTYLNDGDWIVYNENFVDYQYLPVYSLVAFSDDEIEFVG